MLVFKCLQHSRHCIRTRKIEINKILPCFEGSKWERVCKVLKSHNTVPMQRISWLYIAMSFRLDLAVWLAKAQILIPELWNLRLVQNKRARNETLTRQSRDVGTSPVLLHLLNRSRNFLVHCNDHGNHRESCLCTRITWPFYKNGEYQYECLDIFTLATDVF